MRELPKIVRERLRTETQSEHPDADLLTAFSEQSLPVSERATVMGHLALCSDCREVVALALPELEEHVAVLARPRIRPRIWFGMPFLRWGVIAAAAMVIAAVAIARYSQRPPENMTAKLETSEKQWVNPAPSVVNNERDRRGDPAAFTSPRNDGYSQKAMMVAPKVAARVGLPNEGKDSTETATGSNLPRAADGARLRSVAPRQLKKPTTNREETRSDLLKSEGSGLPNSATTEMVEVQGASPVATPESTLDSVQSQKKVEVPQSKNSRQQNQPSSEEGTVVGKAKAPVEADAAMGSPARNEATILPASAAPAVPDAGPPWSITWTINSSGELQRSYDQGKTWQSVNVSSSSAPALAALEAESAAPYSAKAAKAPAKRPSLAIMRAVAALASEVWAGTSGGSLYHSLDSGDHWSSVTVSSNGVFLTGDIVSLQFSDVVHGSLATSTGEVWATADGGQHWFRR